MTSEGKPAGGVGGGRRFGSGFAGFGRTDHLRCDKGRQPAQVRKLKKLGRTDLLVQFVIDAIGKRDQGERIKAVIAHITMGVNFIGGNRQDPRPRWLQADGTHLPVAVPWVEQWNWKVRWSAIQPSRVPVSVMLP